MHDPIGALPLWRAAGVEDERLLHPDDPRPMAHLPVLAGGLPVAPRCGAVGAGTVGVLAVEAAEEVPLGVAGAETGAGWEVPGLELVEVDLGDGVDLERAAENLALEVVGDELLVRGVEAEARREGGGLRGRRGGRRSGGGGRGGVGHVGATGAGWWRRCAARVGDGIGLGKVLGRMDWRGGGEGTESPGRRGVAWAIRKPKGLFGTHLHTTRKEKKRGPKSKDSSHKYK